MTPYSTNSHIFGLGGHPKIPLFGPKKPNMAGLSTFQSSRRLKGSKNTTKTSPTFFVTILLKNIKKIAVPNCPFYNVGAKLSIFTMLVPNCLFLLSWCQIFRCPFVWCQIIQPTFFGRKVHFCPKSSQRKICSTDVRQVNDKFACVFLFICPSFFVVFVVLVFQFGFDFVFELVN